jgi:hypothetical protein
MPWRYDVERCLLSMAAAKDNLKMRSSNAIGSRQEMRLVGGPLSLAIEKVTVGRYAEGV